MLLFYEQKKRSDVKREIYNLKLRLDTYWDVYKNRQQEPAERQRNTVDDVLRLIFLKYITDTHYLAETKEELLVYFNAQHIFREDGRNDQNINAIGEILSFIDGKLGLSGILSSSFDQYEELFNILRSSGKENSHYGTLGYINWINLGSSYNADLYTEAIISAYAEDAKLRKNETRIAKPELSKIVKSILNINPTDTFSNVLCDGLSTVQIVDSVYNRIILNDDDPKTACRTAMLCIMKDYRKFSITSKTLSDGNYFPAYKADKVFADIDMGVSYQFREPKGQWQKYLEERFRDIVENVLSDDGIAVISCKDVNLRSINGQRARQYLAGLHRYVNAVISLPSLWSGSQSTTSLIVLSKENKDILFVDATDAKLNSEFIRNVIDIYHSRTVRPEFSILIPYEEFRSKNSRLSLAPSLYVEKNTFNTEGRKYDEIQNEIVSLVNQLKDFYPELSSIIS